MLPSMLMLAFIVWRDVNVKMSCYVMWIIRIILIINILMATR